MACLFNWNLLLLLGILEFVAGTRLKDMIYTPIDSQAACFRRHNGTHQFGCSSSRSGSIGAIHFIGNETDLKWLELNSTAGPYVAVMSFSMFTRDTLLRLRKTNNINGILLANIAKSRPSHYSPEDTCPNRYSGARECKEKPWNPLGSALLMEDWPFPIFFLQNQTALGEINSCFLKHNAHDLDDQSQRSLCALEMKSFMFAAVDSETCMRRSLSANIHSTLYCEPLGDRNIHWSLSPPINESVILVTARLDATAMFNDLVPGAGSTVTGLVTFLATAYYLKALNATVKKRQSTICNYISRWCSCNEKRAVCTDQITGQHMGNNFLNFISLVTLWRRTARHTFVENIAKTIVETFGFTLRKLFTEEGGTLSFRIEAESELFRSDTIVLFSALLVCKLERLPAPSGLHASLDRTSELTSMQGAGYDMSSGTYSTWTESIWESLSVRMFLKPSPATERLSMAVGSTVAILSIIVVWFFNSRANIIFNTRSENL
ncbi:nicastrin [Belonocnema kinseyi]|uniref:nicastrin n=1 Tax=Belonocnema kinseyi TaxID=2817044 RepID=UPI00143D4794|nr:nicastrin [Belonocnema kinseyi]